MIRQDVYIEDYDWQIILIYNAKPLNARYILRLLSRVGVEDAYIAEARSLLVSGRPNEGLIYNNSRKRVSVVVIGHVSNAWELVDTIEHEGRHLIQGICNAYRIDPNSEETAYMEGRIFKQIVKDFISAL